MNQPRRKSFARPLSELIEPCLADLWRKRGFASSALIVNWREIAGGAMAQRSQPLELRWPSRAPKADPAALGASAVLMVRVEGPFALEFQYAAPGIIDRINAHLGWKAVGKIVMKQGPVQAKPVPKRAPKPLSASAQAKLDRLAPVTDDALGQALRRLGKGVLSG